MRATGVGEVVSQELEFESGEYTLRKADGETLEVEQLECLAEMVYMSVKIRTQNQYIINIHKTEWKVPKDLINHPLEGVSGISES